MPIDSLATGVVQMLTALFGGTIKDAAKVAAAELSGMLHEQLSYAEGTNPLDSLERNPDSIDAQQELTEWLQRRLDADPNLRASTQDLLDRSIADSTVSTDQTQTITADRGSIAAGGDVQHAGRDIKSQHTKKNYGGIGALIVAILAVLGIGGAILANSIRSDDDPSGEEGAAAVAESALAEEAAERATLSTDAPGDGEPEYAFEFRVEELSLTEGGAIGSDESFLPGPRAILVNQRVVEGSWGDPDGQFQWQIFSDQALNSVSISPEIDPETEVMQTTIGIQQDPKADPGVVVALVVRSKSSGLNASGGHLELQHFDSTGSRHQRHRIERAIDASAGYGKADTVSQVAVVGQVAVLRGHFLADGDHTFATDLRTGKQLWDRRCGDDGMDGSSTPPDIVTDARTVAFSCGHHVVGLDVTTGTERWTIANPLGFTDSGGRRVGHLDGPTSSATLGHVVVSGGGGNTAGLLDLSTGRFVQGDSYIDPAGELGVVDIAGPNDSLYEDEWKDSAPTLQVIDLTTSQTTYTVTAAQRRALGTLKVLGAYDGRLWIWTEDGLDVVDARTGSRDPLAPTKTEGYQHSRNVPTSAGDAWVLLSNTNGNGEPQPAQLVRDPTGEITANDLPASEVTSLSLD